MKASREAAKRLHPLLLPLLLCACATATLRSSSTHTRCKVAGFCDDDMDGDGDCVYPAASLLAILLLPADLLPAITTRTGADGSPGGGVGGGDSDRAAHLASITASPRT